MMVRTFLLAQLQDLIAAWRGAKLPVGEAQPCYWAVGQTLQYAGLGGASLASITGLFQPFSATAGTALASI